MRSEATKAEQMTALLNELPLHLSRVTKAGSNVEYCQSFLEDLKSRRGIEYIEPVLQTDDIDHPDLQHYRKCLKYDHPSNVDLYIRYYDLRELGDRNFKLYRLPIHGMQEYIYAELDRKRLALNQVPGYWRIDLGNCIRSDFVPMISKEEMSSQRYTAIETFNYRWAVVCRRPCGNG